MAQTAVDVSTLGNPSPVLHVRALHDHCSEQELRAAFSHFGAINQVLVLTHKRQALIEMASIREATSAITFGTGNPIQVGPSFALINYSRSTELNKTNRRDQPAESAVHNGEHTVFMTIMNPLYPITVDVLNTIFSPFGAINRIVIFHKQGIQALVEFTNANAALQSQTALNGKDIYDGCCTLKIEFSKIDTLNVRFNSELTRDFTDPSLPTQSSQHPPAQFTQHQPPHHQQAQFGGYQQAPNGRPCVIMYNLPTDQRPELATELYNLITLYGVVQKIKFIQNKPGTALVQFAEQSMADKCMEMLDNTVIEGEAILVHKSRHPAISDSRPSENGETSFYDTVSFESYRNFRPDFKNMSKPTKVLFFNNTPPDTDETSFPSYMDELDLPRPTHIKMLPNNDPSKTNRRGLIEFADVETATKVVMRANNARVGERNTLRLAFSRHILSEESS
eukprot:TRINITY_DN10107_c0_g1_i1.p1 TRINITY_DN10107_c0_g1~~TRINITY_DN10107_c0_g1_i1.p1  ORF type:complete len:516 (-),score=122.51 TRINITY_DN10107_c0_g1_i1:51-1400(-)